MGQYYYPILLTEDGRIMVWMCAHNYGNGAKLTEHSFLGNNFVSTFEWSLSPEGPYHKTRLVWAGDYADPEPGQENNLYRMCDEYNMIRPKEKDTGAFPFVVNHTKRQFVDKEKVPIDNGGMRYHPLPLLTAEGNGRGGGDYHGDSPLVGSWARDVISVEESAPEGFEEILFTLRDDDGR
jgi:hypothetical protein